MCLSHRGIAILCTELNCWGKVLWHQTQWVGWLSIDKYGVEIMYFLLEEKKEYHLFLESIGQAKVRKRKLG